MMKFEAFRQTKLYDFLTGLPLILWFGLATLRLRPNLVADARDMIAAPGNVLFDLRFLALFSAASFNLLLVYLVAAPGGARSYEILKVEFV